MVTDDSIYQGYVCVTNVAKDSVTLQNGETIDYQWVSKEQFLQIFPSDTFVDGLRERLQESAASEMKWLVTDEK